MKPYIFEVHAEVVATVPGILSVHATSFEEAVRLACAPEARAKVELEPMWAQFDTPESLDLSSVRDGRGELVMLFCSTLGGPLDDHDLAAVREADQAEASA